MSEASHTTKSDPSQGNTSSGPAPSESSSAIKASLRGLDYASQVQMLSVVQRSGGGTTESVHQAAAHGVSGSAGKLPHGDAIQKSFGGYDISNVQAYNDKAATDASRAMGAEAYATGNRVAFAGAPDLHTAAHEAAHVVQQKAGVSLSSGVGSSGDMYERHADRVADAVVAGQDAAPVLSELAGGAGGGGGTTQSAVQKLENPNQVPENEQEESDGEGHEETPEVANVPYNGEDWRAHIRAKFAAEIAELKSMQQKQIENGGEFRRENEGLASHADQIKALADKKDKSADDVKELKRLQGLESTAGMTMGAMLAEAQALLQENREKYNTEVLQTKEAADRMKQLMFSSMELSKQLDEDGTEAGRTFYNKIDKEEGGLLLLEMERVNMPIEERARLASMYRTEARCFMRDEIMSDMNAAEILYLRDLGANGARTGITFDEVVKKEAAKLGIDNILEATDEEKDEVYDAVIGSAHRTNEDVNKIATGSSDGLGKKP